MDSGVRKLYIPDKDSSLEMEPCLGKSVLHYHKGFGNMILVSKEAWQLLHHTVAMRNQMESAHVGITWVPESVPVLVVPDVQVMGLEVVCQLAVDDEIYM